MGANGSQQGGVAYQGGGVAYQGGGGGVYQSQAVVPYRGQRQQQSVQFSQQGGDRSGGDDYTVYGGRPGKIIRKTTCCDEPEPNIIVHNHKKIIHYDSDSDDEITIVTPPPVVVMPPPTNVIIMPNCPEKPKPCGPSTFFPEVRERSYRMETQTKSGPCMSAPCVSIQTCGPCGGAAPPSCGRCHSYHRM